MSKKLFILLIILLTLPVFARADVCQDCIADECSDTEEIDREDYQNCPSNISVVECCKKDKDVINFCTYTIKVCPPASTKPTPTPNTNPPAGGQKKGFLQPCTKSEECEPPYVCNVNRVCGFSDKPADTKPDAGSTDQTGAGSTDPVNIDLNIEGGIKFFGLFEADSLPDLISKLYDYSIALVGLAVFFQFFRAGFLYLVSAGNSSKIGEANSIMTSAIIGAVLLFSAYLILNVINPELVNNSFSFTIPGTSGNIGQPSPSGPNDPGPGGSGNTNKDPTNCGDFNLVCSTTAESCKPDKSKGKWDTFIAEAAGKYDIGGGIDTKKFLNTIMRIESEGVMDVFSKDKDGKTLACGLMQFLPDTANKFATECGLERRDISCDWLRGKGAASEDQVARVSFCLAAKYAKSIVNSKCYKGQVRDIAGGYNGGDGCDVTNKDGNALALSVSCSNESTAGNKYSSDCNNRSTVRYECLWDDLEHKKCNDGFKQTRTYVARFNACYYGK